MGTARLKTCKICARILPEGAIQCPICRKVNIDRPTISNGQIDINDGTVALSDVKADDVKRISTGPWDKIFGESCDDNGNLTDSGIVVGSTALVGGEPGAGKSTLALQMGDEAIQKQKDIEKSLSTTLTKAQESYILLLLSEESPPQVRYRANRLRIRNMDRIRVVSLMSGEKTVQEILEGLSRKPMGIIVDSTDKLPGLQDMMKAVKCWINDPKPFAWCLFIHHVNKGMNFHGEMGIQHEVDTTIGFFNTSNDGVKRTMAVMKNRFGQVGVSVDFAMTERGLVVMEDEEGEEDEDGEDEGDELITIPYGTIPPRDQFFNVCPPKIESDDLTCTAEQIYDMLEKNADTSDKQSLLDLLQIAGFDWDSPA